MNECMEQDALSIDMKKADLLRQLSEKWMLDADSIKSVLCGESERRLAPNRTPTVKVSKAIYVKYFKPDQSAKEIQAIVEKALEQFFSR